MSLARPHFLALFLLLATAPAFAEGDEHKGEHRGEHGPCKKVMEACKAAGFVLGGAKDGKGLYKDCLDPIVHGETVAGVTLDAADVAACKAKKKNHGDKKPHEKS